MADHKDPKDKQEYSVDDILAEYGSGKYGSSTVSYTHLTLPTKLEV